MIVLTMKMMTLKSIDVAHFAIVDVEAFNSTLLVILFLLCFHL